MILIRVDGNSKIGMGHLIRCLALADKVKAQYHEQIEFVTAKDTSSEIIGENGFKTHTLKSLSGNMTEEIPELLNLAETLKPMGIIVDSYGVDENYLRSIKKDCFVMYVDDLAAWPYPVDYLLNYNIYAEEETYRKLYKGSGVEMPKLFLGPKYALLRKQFQGIRRICIRDHVKNIFISAGGSDPEGITLKTIKGIMNDQRWNGVNFHFIVGLLNPDYEAIVKLSDSIENIIIHYNVSNMAELMCSCDVAVSAAGSTLYELCACGVPTLTYVLADNQIDGAKCFARKEIMINLGDCRDNGSFVYDMTDRLYEVCCDKKLRERLSENMSRIAGAEA